MSNCWPGCDGPAIRYISAAPSLEWQHRERHDLVILGSTGSIGRNALGVVDCHPQRFRILALSCARNVDMLARQARRYRPRLLAVLDEESAYDLRSLLPADYRPEILVGPQGYATAASLPEADTVLSAQVGAAGLEGTLAAALAGKVICLANKESLVCGGELVMRAVRERGIDLVPVDSEHSALFQCLAFRRDAAFSRLVLTASGGPFYRFTQAELARVTAADALRHPTWNMGAKITIDSATLLNKGYEVIEAKWLYETEFDKIGAVVRSLSSAIPICAYPSSSRSPIPNAFPAKSRSIFPRSANLPFCLSPRNAFPAFRSPSRRAGRAERSPRCSTRRRRRRCTPFWAGA